LTPKMPRLMPAQAYAARLDGTSATPSLSIGSNGSAGGSSRDSSGAFAGSALSGFGGYHTRNKKGHNGGGYSSAQSFDGGGGQQHYSNTTPAPWAGGYNHYTSLVQAWSMTIRAPRSDFLSPRPSFQPQQSMTALHQSLLLPPPPPVNAWDNQVLYMVLQSADTSADAPHLSSSEWFLDTGASNHMSSFAGNLHSPHPVSCSIVIENGARLPISCMLPTPPFQQILTLYPFVTFLYLHLLSKILFTFDG
jgi:hypothetical protein